MYITAAKGGLLLLLAALVRAVGVGVVVEVFEREVFFVSIFSCFCRPCACAQQSPPRGEQSDVLFYGIVVAAAGGGDSQSSSCKK